MEWLTPISAIGAAAVALPLLLLLYFLKLKRREHPVSSTLLWRRAVQDLQVNAPFQRLRRNILLFLQLLAILAVLVALAGPILSLTSRATGRYVLLIDRSASMNATDVQPSRLEAGKQQAKAFVESLSNKSLFSFGGGSDQIMVIAFDSRCKVMCNFTTDGQQLLGAIDSIEGGDGDSALSEAILVAQAFAASDEQANNRSSEVAAKLVLFSDGQIRDLDQVLVGGDELEFRAVGQSGRNVAITAMQARRAYDDPEQVEVFATIANYDREAVTCDVQLRLDNDVRSVRSVTIPAADSNSPDKRQPGKVAINFSLAHAGAGIVEVRHFCEDSLSSDNAAWAVLLPPQRVTAVLVTRGNPVLESALRVCPLAELKVVDPSVFDSNESAVIGVGSADAVQDVIVLDDYVPKRLPRSRYLVFGRPPNDIDVTVSEELKNQVVVDWRPKHPVLKYVSLMNLFVARCYNVALPRDAEVLAEFSQSPALSLLRRGGSVFLLAPFDVLQSNWPFEPGFVLFCHNAMNFLSMQVGQDQQGGLDVGQPIVVEGLKPETAVKVTAPGSPAVESKTTSAGVMRFPATDRVGVYSVDVSEEPARFFAVNMLDADESEIEPRKEIVLAGQTVQAQQSVARANLPVWPWLVGLALMLACAEWLAYNLKVRI